MCKIVRFQLFIKQPSQFALFHQHFREFLGLLYHGPKSTALFSWDIQILQVTLLPVYVIFGLGFETTTWNTGMTINLRDEATD